MGIFFYSILGWATLPHCDIFGHEPFNMGYLIEYFAVDTLAACACLFYALNGYRVSLNQQWIGLIGAAIFNFYAFLHTVVAVINRRGVFTPEVKWGVTDRKAAFEELRSQLVPFFHHFAEHLRSEEANLNAVGRKYVPLELMKQISRQVWRIAPADRWEVIVPFVVNNLSATCSASAT